MLSNYIEQLFKLDNYYDGLIVTDNKGYIEFFMTYRPDISGAKQEDLIGKHVLDIYPGLTEETCGRCVAASRFTTNTRP